MRIKPRIAINLAGVALLAVVTVGWVLVKLVAPGVINKPFAVTADFAASGGVFTNQEVTYRGVLIGKVGEMKLNDDGVTIELLIEPDWEDKIPANTSARIQSKSAVGEQFVNLTPTDDPSTETLSDGDRIPREATSLPVDFQALLRTLDNVLADVPPERTRKLIETLSRGVGGRSNEIALILESLGTLADTFASVAPEQQRLLDTSTTTGKAFLDSKDEFVAAMKAADDVLEGLGDEPQELRRLFLSNDRVAREGLRLIARNGDDLHAGIKALSDFVDYQLATRDVIHDFLIYVPAFLHAIEDASLPWRAPDGSEYYRIRVGLVIDNVQSTWPCKYGLPKDYHRLPHVRDYRVPITIEDLECKRGPIAGNPTSAEASDDDGFYDALRALLKEAPRDDPAGGTETEDTDWGDVWEDYPTEPEPTAEPSPSPTPSPEASPSPDPSPEH